MEHLKHGRGKWWETVDSLAGKPISQGLKNDRSSSSTDSNCYQCCSFCPHHGEYWWWGRFLLEQALQQNRSSAILKRLREFRRGGLLWSIHYAIYMTPILAFFCLYWGMKKECQGSFIWQWYICFFIPEVRPEEARLHTGRRPYWRSKASCHLVVSPQ